MLKLKRVRAVVRQGSEENYCIFDISIQLDRFLKRVSLNSLYNNKPSVGIMICGMLIAQSHKKVLKSVSSPPSPQFL